MGYQERIAAALADTVQDLRDQNATLRRMHSANFKSAADQNVNEELVRALDAHRRAGIAARNVLREIRAQLVSQTSCSWLEVPLEDIDAALAMEPKA